MIKNKEKIAIDMDEVLADLMGAWINWGIKRSTVNPEFISNTLEWDVSKSFPDLSKKEVYSYLNEEGTFLNLELIEGAKKAVKELHNYYDIYFLTAARNRTAFSEKIKWIEKHFGQTLSRKVIAVSDGVLKNTLSSSFDIIIDDNPKYIENSTEDTITVLFTADHNKNVEDSAFDYRANNWKELLKWLIERHQSRELELQGMLRKID